MTPEWVLPAFDAHAALVAPWTEHRDTFGWVGVMGFCVAAACGLLGNYLLLRRMALMGDAVSHSVLPGLVLAFLLSGGRGTGAMFVGALVAGLVATLVIDLLQSRTPLKQDAAIGIVFSTLFAIGVVLAVAFAGQIDLDPDCVLNGELLFVALEPPVTWGSWTLAPPAIIRMALVLALVLGVIVGGYRVLLVSSFDPGIARSAGVNVRGVRLGLMLLLSLVVVSAFEAVGAVLVVAMLILPGATATLITERLPRMHGLAVVHAAVSVWLGVGLAVWLDCSLAPAIVVAGAVLFGVAWLLGPRGGLIVQLWARGRVRS
jgi:manganese/zinc/iron transport system permease protein